MGTPPGVRPHAWLLRGHLDEVARQRHEVLERQAFLVAYLQRLLPRAGIDLRQDRAENRFAATAPRHFPIAAPVVEDRRHATDRIERQRG